MNAKPSEETTTSTCWIPLRCSSESRYSTLELIRITRGSNGPPKAIEESSINLKDQQRSRKWQPVKQRARDSAGARPQFHCDASSLKRQRVQHGVRQIF